MKTNLKHLIFALLFFVLIPFTTQAGVWEQSSQADFERGTVQGDIIIVDNEIRVHSGIIYENAEDENTDGWSLFTEEATGEVRNVFDEDNRSRVIEFENGIINNTDTGFRFGNSIEYPLNLKFDIKSSQKFICYLVVNTFKGTRVLTYSPIYSTEIRGMYVRHNIAIPYDGSWHTISRNIVSDLHKFEPDNNIFNVRYIGFRGNTRIDNISFIPSESTYISPVFDLGENEVASLGRMIWEEEVPERTSLTLQSRTSANGSNWSEWSEEYDNAAGEAVTSTPQRYFQYKANINNSSNAEAIPKLRRTLLEYNRVPNVTENLLPANDRRLSNTDNLTWDASFDPDKEDSLTYTLEIDNDAGFGSLDSVTSRIANTEININQLENFTNLQDDTKYYWRIKTVDSQNNQSNYSDGEKFFILDKENQAPITPNTGFNPNEGGIVKTQKPTLYWSAASDPDDTDTKETLSYIIQIDKNNRFDNAKIYNTETNRTNFTIPENIEDNTQYFYRIKTKDNEGAESIWSDTQNFVVATGKNPIITLSKTVGVNADDNSQSSLLLGFINNNINFTNFEYIYWLAIILAIAIAFFFLNKNILFNYILTPARNKKGSNKKQKFNYLFAKSIRSLDGVNNTKRVTAEAKGSRTKPVIAIIIIIGIIALALVGIYYYNDNPSPYKDDGKNVQVGDELIYRIDFKNKGESSASNFNILDNIPEGTSYIENSANVNGNVQTDTNDDDAVTLNSSKIKFEFEEIAAKSSGYVSFRVKVKNIPENHKIENAADILFNESNVVQNTNQTTNYIEKGTSTISTLRGIVWNDGNVNKAKDEDEYGRGKIIVRLYEDKNNDNILNDEDNSYLDEDITDSDGNYQFNNVAKGNYFIKIDEENLSNNYSITTDNNPQLITLDQAKEYSDINFGIISNNDEIVIEGAESPRGSIGNLVWMDSNNNGNKDFGEMGLENVNIKLYEDNNNNGTLEFDQDTHVSTHKTNSSGNYQITGLSPKTYLILVEENTLPTGEFRLTTPNNPVVVKLESENQEFNDANFGYYIENDIGKKIKDNIPEVITSDKDYNKLGTVSFTPIKVSEADKADKIAPPILTHLGPAQIENYDDKLSIPINENLLLKGKAGANSTITLFIHSELNLKTVTSTNQEGIWEIIINTKLFEAGEHKIYAQSEDTEGNLSARVEIAKFKINKDEKIAEQFNYWLALGGLAIIATTIIITTWIKEKGRGTKPKTKVTRKPKLKTKPKIVKNNARKVTKKTSTRRKIKVK